MTLTTTKPATLRNRVRVTNKTRLRVFRNPRDDDVGNGDDGEAAEGISTAGVDVEDAKEHHLQAVLSAAAASRRVEERAHGSAPRDDPAIVIPIPDHTGLVDGYDAHYPAGRFSDPITFFKCVSTIEENVNAGLNAGFTYYMDERDKEWLDAHNELSTECAVSSAGLRSRNMKMKEKEQQQAANAFPATYDEFELVMGLLEMITEHKVPFLHHNHTGDASYPPLSVYQEILSKPLLPSFFSAWAVPLWVPEPSRMLSLGDVIFPYWQRLRKARDGRRIIPTLNYDESDVQNESYVCFRRREIKAMRKTRGVHVSAADKLQRLQKELMICGELAGALCKRETLKRQLLQTTHNVWTDRKSVADLLLAFPSLGANGDEDLLVDVEPVVRKRKAPETRVHSPEVAKHSKAKLSKDAKTSPTWSPFAPTTKGPKVMPPQERYNLIVSLEQDELRQTLANNHPDWNDLTEDPCEAVITSQADRFFASLSADSSKLSYKDAEFADTAFEYRAVRMRRGRGGVLRLDRRLSGRQTQSVTRMEPLGRMSNRSLHADGSEEGIVGEELAADEERGRHLRGQWMFDRDDAPLELSSSRQLTDEFERKYMVSRPLLIHGSDVRAMTVDFTLSWTDEENRVQTRVQHVFGPDPRDAEKAKEVVEKARVQWNRQYQARMAARAQPPPAHVASQAASPSSAQSTAMDVDSHSTATPGASLAVTSSAGSASSVSTSATSELSRATTPQEPIRGRPIHPVRGAIHMPCIPPTSQHDLTALAKRYGVLNVKAVPSRPPSITRTPSHPSA